MSISRLTKERLYQDEQVFNQLLPFAKYDEEFEIFIHADASLWSMWELQPQWITRVSDVEAFQTCTHMQELLDSLEHDTSVQFSWITTFDVDNLLRDCINRYPCRGPAGWMARRWVRSVKQASQSDNLHRRPRQLRLIVGF